VDVLGLNSADPAIAIRDLHVSFEDLIVVDGLSVDIPRGSVFAIMGRSGTGKSVTLKVLCGLLAPDSGEVIVDGRRVNATSPASLRALRENMGFVFQNAALINWMTAGDNVALPLIERGRPRSEVDPLVRSHLSDVGLLEAADKFPDELSGGMRKRVGFARATITDPDVILYDEPTTGLDPETTKTIDELIVRGRDRFSATSVVVTHDVTSALRIADHIGILHDGRMPIILTPEEFVRSEDPRVRAYTNGTPHSGGKDT
jgi:phospholipid/cholesterol/gamma-HCH transport system ATP-binding protein